MLTFRTENFASETFCVVCKTTPNKIFHSNEYFTSYAIQYDGFAFYMRWKIAALKIKMWVMPIFIFVSKQREKKYEWPLSQLEFKLDCDSFGMASVRLLVSDSR